MLSLLGENGVSTGRENNVPIRAKNKVPVRRDWCPFLERMVSLLGDNGVSPWRESCLDLFVKGTMVSLPGENGISTRRQRWALAIFFQVRSPLIFYPWIKN